MKRLCVLLFGTLLIGAFSFSPVSAFPQFNNAFKAKYAGVGASEDFKSAVKSAKCNVCHDPNKKDDKGKPTKKYRNPYGQALDKLLGKGDKKNKNKIREALETVGNEKAPDSDETFGARIKSGRLPYELP